MSISIAIVAVCHFVHRFYLRQMSLCRSYFLVCASKRTDVGINAQLWSHSLVLRCNNVSYIRARAQPTWLQTMLQFCDARSFTAAISFIHLCSVFQTTASLFSLHSLLLLPASRYQTIASQRRSQAYHKCYENANAWFFALPALLL